MTFLRDVIAATVSASGLSVPVTITVAGVDVRTSGTTNTGEDDEAILSGNGIGVDRTVRVPVADFAVAPHKSCRAVVDGETFVVDDAHLRNRVYLITLKRVAVR